MGAAKRCRLPAPAPSTGARDSLAPAERCHGNRCWRRSRGPRGAARRRAGSVQGRAPSPEVMGGNWFMEMAERRRRAPGQARPLPPVLPRRRSGAGGGEGPGLGGWRRHFETSRCVTCWSPARPLSSFPPPEFQGGWQSYLVLASVAPWPLGLCSGALLGKWRRDLGSPGLGDRGAAYLTCLG